MAWNRLNEQGANIRDTGSGKARHVILGVVAGAIVVIIATIAMRILWSIPDAERQSSGTGRQLRIREVKPAPAPKAEIAAKTPMEESKQPNRPKTFEEELAELQRKIANGETNVTLIIAGNPIITNSTEQLLATVFTTRLGDMPPMLPKVSLENEADLIRIIDRSYEIKESDSADVAEMKAAVNEAKVALDKYMREGGSVNKFLSYYSGLLENAHQEYLMCRQEAMRACRQEDPGFAREYIEKMNARLREKGIKEIKLLPAQKRKLGIE